MKIQKYKQQAFTLVELMVTIAIMGIMAAIAMPSFNNFVAKSRLNNRAEQIANLFRYAQGEAVRMNVPVVICGDTIRSDGRPSGQCNANVFNTANNAANRSGLKAFADNNRDGTYSSTSSPKDIDIRTISINGNGSRRQVDMILQYCGVSASNCVNAHAPSQMIFFPNGQFAVQKSANSLDDAMVASHFVQFRIQDATQPDSANLRRYVVISPSGSVKVCGEQSGATRQLC